MPNHVENNLCVFGDAQDVQDFRNVFIIEKDGGYTAKYNGIHPMPQELNADVSPLPKRDGETDKQYDTRMKKYKKLYGADNWYDWRWQNWKTKWEVYDFNLCLDEIDRIECSFNSAWSPPVGWLKKAVEMFPNLHFTMDYIDEADMFCGLSIGIEGEFLNKEAQVEYQDKDGNKVVYSSNYECYMRGDEKILDEDYYPNRINPLL
jgi:hypothetical protein